MNVCVRRLLNHRNGSWFLQCREHGLPIDGIYRAEFKRWHLSYNSYDCQDIFVYTPDGRLFYTGLTKFFERIEKTSKTLEDFL